MPRRPAPITAAIAALALLLSACSGSLGGLGLGSLDPNGGVSNGGGNAGGGGGPAPGQGQPQLVVPKPGQQNPHPVPVTELRSKVDGHHVLLNVLWWSGVEPCSVLDSVRVRRDGTTVTLTVIEGSSARDVACVDIAVERVTLVDLGELPSGTYTITTDPALPHPITVVVS